MKFLSILGRIIVEGTKIITGLGSVLPKTTVPMDRIVDTLERVIDIIINIEAFGQALGITGPDKLKAAIPMVTQILLQSDVLAGKKIDNHPLFKQGAEKIASGVADILNSLKPDAISTSDTD